MGLDNEGARRICFDLETVALSEAGDYLEPVSAPGNYKDPDKIALFVAEKQAEALAKAALDPDLCRVVALGLMVEMDDHPSVHVLSDEGDERMFLDLLWRMPGVLVGFNCIEFDLPVLLRRSLYLGITPPSFTLNKYRPSSNVVDLMQDLSFQGKLRYRSLDFYCRRFGLDVPKDDTKGSDIARLVSEGNWDAVSAHCRIDVLKTAALAQRLGVMRAAQLQEAVL